MASSIISICTAHLRGAWFLALPASVLVLLLVYIIYALYLHPLASYPGPLLGRLTKAYDVYHAYKGDKHILFYHLHQQYGPIVRFSPNTLSINSPGALRAIYGNNANVQKSVFYECFRAAPNAVSTLLATDKAQHARKRRVMGQAFSEQAVRGLEQYVLGHVQDLVDKIGVAVDSAAGEKAQWSAALDMGKYCKWLVFDIMGDLVFGKSFGTLGETPENREGIRLLGRAARRNYVVAAMPALARFERWLPYLRGLYLDRLQYLAFGKKQVLARQQEQGAGETGRRDIFSFLLHAKDPNTGEGFPLPELFMEGNTLIVAGSDTSSTTLCATLFYLLHNPAALARLTHEVRLMFPTGPSIHMGVPLQSCTYLKACIDEAMRMTPAVPGILPRQVLRGGLDLPMLNTQLPAGIDVGVPIYALQHHPQYVTNPFAFDPARWCEKQHPQDREALLSVFCPLSTGGRSCLGKPLVYMELGIAVARLVWEYDMRLASVQPRDEGLEREVREGKRHPGDYQTRDWFLSAGEGFEVEFRRRRF